MSMIGRKEIYALKGQLIKRGHSAKDTVPSTSLPALSSRLLRALAMALVCVAVATAADARGQRIALVIGNGNYQYADLPKLANPTNDAEDMARVLRGFGFEVIERKNQTLEGMNRAISEFGSKIGGSEVALFYYAGHGIQVKNQNYLVPVNAKIESEAAVPYQGVSLNQVLDEMDNGKSSANIVILDACRNNPITGKFRSGQSRGLAIPTSAPKGTVIVYATDPGNVASDGTGRNGLFTAGLLTAFKGKDLTLDGVLTAASAEVEKASRGAQTPYVNGPKTLQKNLDFHITVEPGLGDIERTFWTSIERSNDAADFEAYLQKYPAGSYKALAENRLKRLKADQQASPAPAATAPLATSSGRSSKDFDGRWAITFICEDVPDGNKIAKGYTLNFFTDVQDGKLTGQDGKIGQPGYLSLVGVIMADGSAEIDANGLIGNPQSALGRVNPGSPYSYHLRGTFTPTSGKATRIGVRPCEATFTRN
jgi:hypothetical protein